MNAADFAAYLIDISACEPAREWAAGKTAQEAWDQCEQPEWLCWWAFRAGRGAALVPVLYACADRAVREYAPAALRSAGLTAAADKLAALSPVVDATTASAASYAASAASDARYAASYAASAASDARYAASYAASAASYAASAASYAASAASYAASAASYAAEQKRQCAEIRAALPAAPCP